MATITPLNQTSNIDPLTGKPRVTNLPYANATAPLPIMPPVPQVGAVAPIGGAAPTEGALNQQVLQTAQQKAITGFQSPVMDLTSQRTQELLQNPQLGEQQQAAQKQALLEQADRERSQSLETLRRQTSGVSTTGENLNQLIDVGLRGAEYKADLQRQLNAEEGARQKENVLRALTEGRATGEQERLRFGTDIGALAQIRGAAEGAETRAATSYENSMDRGLAWATTTQNVELQKFLTDIKGKQEMGQLLQAQDFQGTQAELDRLQEKAIQEGDIAGQVQITQLRGEIDAQAQAAQQAWSSAERVANQGWQTGERLSEQDFTAGQSYLDRQLQDAISTKNIEAQKYLESQKASLQLAMQTNEMDYGTKMAYLNNELANATADKDVLRQEQILTFRHTQEMESIVQQQGFEAGQTYLGQQFQLAMQSNDHVQAQTLQRLQLEAQATEHAKDLAIEEARVALQEKGVDMAQIEQQYSMIQSEVEAGRVAPDAAFQFLQSTVASQGITLTALDATQAIKQAMDAEYDAQVYQFAKTHPEYVDTSTESGLSQEGLMAYNEFFNESVYGKTTIEDMVNSITGKTDEAELATITAQASPWEGKTVWQTAGNNQRNFSGGTPAINTPFTLNGKTYLVITNVAVNYKTGTHEEYEYFTAKDLASGTIVTIKATGSGAQVG
mgnify:CR=1 FL=1